MSCRSPLLLLLSATLALLGGCHATTMEELCEDSLPESTRKVENALTVLTTVEPEREPSRGLASAGFSFSPPSRALLKGIELSETDRHSWQDWAQSRLKESQSVLDLVAARPELRAARQDLTDIANAWVAFDGYAHLSQVDRMVTVLEKIRESENRAASRVCVPPRAGP